MLCSNTHDLLLIGLRDIQHRGQQMERHWMMSVVDHSARRLCRSLKSPLIDLVYCPLLHLTQQAIPLIIEAQETLPKVDIERLSIGTTCIEPAQNGRFDNIQRGSHCRTCSG